MRKSEQFATTELAAVISPCIAQGGGRSRANVGMAIDMLRVPLDFPGGVAGETGLDGLDFEGVFTSEPRARMIFGLRGLAVPMDTLRVAEEMSQAAFVGEANLTRPLRVDMNDEIVERPPNG